MRVQIVLALVFLLIHLNISVSSASDRDSSRVQTGISTKSKIALDNPVTFDSLFQQSLSLLYNNPDSARLIIQEAFSLNLFDNQMEKLKSLNLLGVTHHLQANYIKALDYYYEALPLAVDLNDNKCIANIYNNVGSVNLKIGNYKNALDYFLKANNYYNELGLIENKSSILNNIGLLYMDIDNFEKARLYFRQAYQGFELKDDSIGMAATLSNIGTLFDEYQKVDSAFYYINRAVGINERLDNKYGLCISLQAKANTFLSNKMYEQAIEYYVKSNAVAKLINHDYQQGYTYLGLAKVRLKTSETGNSLHNAELAMQIANKINNKRLKQEIYKIFSEIFEQMGDYEKGLAHFKTSVELKEELINQTKLHQIYNLEIEQLSLAKEIQQLEIQRQELLLSKKNTIIIFIVVAFILILTGIYLLYLNYNHRRNANLQKTILSLTEKKSRAAAEAEIQERKRIGEELHDGLGQMLSVARLNISVLQQKTVLTDQRKKELLEAALHSVDEAFFELRNISHNLVPSVLLVKGLATALRELADQVNQSKHINVQLEMHGLNGAVDGIIENTLYRAAQEMLNNAIKHSNAVNFFMQIVKSDKEITLMVEDDGNGFNYKNTLIIPGGGLSNIRSRVENLNGYFFVDSMEKRGTIISIVIPIKKPDYVKTGNSGIGG